jgi:beta-glucosidase
MISSCSFTGKPIKEIQSSTPTPENAATFIEDILSRMTLEEKIGQMTQVERGSIKPGDIKKYFIGSILSGGGSYPTPNNINSWVEMITQFQDEALSTRLQIPIIYGIDAIHGMASLYGATVFPHQVGLGATRDSDLVRQIGQATAEEMLATGISWSFSPVVAVPQDIRWGRTYESYGEDTDLVTEMSGAFISGLQSIPEAYTSASGQTLFVLATPKHYLGDGGTIYGTSTQLFNEQPYLLDQGDMQYDETAVRDLFLPPYQAAIKNGAMSIMISFSSWNGTRMHASKYWITDVLKGELGFQGLVVSDWAGIDQINGDYYSAVVTAINAGIDMNMVPIDYIRFIKTMKQAVKKGDISEERINDAVRRILTVKYQLGLFSDPYPHSDLLETVGSDSHRAIARKAVRESLVLLKNEHDALPLKKDVSLIYIAGVAANDIGIQCGGWTTQWQGEAGDIQPGTTILEGIKDTVSAGSTIEYSPDGQFEGLADVGIAVVGESPYAEGVGDKSDLSLTTQDIQILNNLKEHSKKLIVIIISGRPLVITDQYLLADAWVAAWLPGTEGGGVADVLFGDYPFTGKLPFTWPRSDDQLPMNINNDSDLTGCVAPLFPYGFGMDKQNSQPIEWIECE